MGGPTAVTVVPAAASSPATAALDPAPTNPSLHEPLGDAQNRAWVVRALGVGWLTAAGVLVVAGLGGQPLSSLIAAVVGVIGLALLFARGVDLPSGAVDAVLFASTNLVGLVALAAPGHAMTMATCVAFAVPFACALLPQRRALLQLTYVVLMAAAILVVSFRAGDLAATAALIHGLLVTALVLSVAVAVLRLTEHLRRRTLIAETLARLGHRALSVSEPDELLSHALRMAVDVIGADYGTALRQLPDGRVRVAAELGPHPIAPGTLLMLADAGSYAERIMQSGEAFVSTDLRKDPRVAPPTSLLRRGIVSGLAVPVLGSRQSLGVLALHFRQRRQFTRDEVAATTALAGVVATAWEQAAQREKISHQAMHDPLTDLPNRALFVDRLEQALSRRTPIDSPESGTVCLMLLDLDNFKDVNDSLGHHAGDEFLTVIAGRLLDQLRPEDTLARLGGDEFAVLCERAPDEHTATRLAKRVLAAVAEPLEIEGSTVSVTACAGVTLGVQSQVQTGGARTLLREADTALYAAKREGRGGRRLFDERLQQQTRNRLQLESELRDGLDRGQFVLHYQPVRSPADQRVLGMEALLRWQHPDRGLIMPGEFIPVAEQTGLIVPLGRWVLETACAQTARWQQEHPRSQPEAIWVAVNVSPRQLDDAGLPDLVCSTLRETGLAPDSLSLELTETALLADGDMGLEALTRLHDAGAKLVLDDFGTGYSSLSHLTRFPIGALKVDGSFVAGLGRNPRDSAVVSAVIALGAELGLKVIAEGVESVEQLSLLRETGCYGVQGFLMDRPVAAPSLDPTSH